MKHIKSYENTKTIFNKNDFVLLTNNIDEFLLPYAKIITKYKYKSTDAPIYRYQVEILFPNTKHWAYYPNEDSHTTVISEFLIIKKLSKKEIEYVKLKLNADKYNL